MATRRSEILISKIRPGQPRDWFQFYAETANLAVYLFDQYHVIGLDLLVHNRGAASLTIQVDAKAAKTVLAGDCFAMNNVIFSQVAVTSAVDYDMVLTGVVVRWLRD